MKKVLIFGSCVSRDIFTYQNEANMQLELVAYYARSSLASAFSELAIEDVYTAKLASPFQRKIVNYDLSKTFSKSLVKYEFDILLMDFIDERFDLFITPDNAICTLSGELLRTDFLSLNTKGRKLDSEEAYLLWEKGWKKLVQTLKSMQALDKLRILKTYWLKSDSSIPNNGYTNQMVDKANQALNLLYVRAAQDLSPEQFITCDEKTLILKDNHRWGYAPFHYSDGFYLSVLGQLTGDKFWRESLFENKNKDLEKWNLPVYRYLDVEQAIKSRFVRDGLYQIYLGNNLVLDINIQNSALLKEKDSALIFFNGAITNRCVKQGPFFSGVGIGKNFKLPMICISDPTIDLDKTVSLSWYAGNEKLPKLQETIATILNAIAKEYQIKPLLIGGSGGGFAALSVQAELRCDSIALIWNPQTTIENYYPRFVKSYIQTAFPSFFKSAVSDMEGGTTQRELFVKVFERANIIHDLKHVQVNDKKKIVFLQNRHDSHLHEHANPFLTKFAPWQNVSDNSYTNKDRSIYVIFGDWGDGHSAPDRETIISFIRLCELNNIGKPVDEFENRLKGITEKNKAFDWKYADKHELSFNIETNLDLVSKTLAANTVIDVAHEKDEYTYAFYLLENGIKVETRWYENNPMVEFDLRNREGNLEIVAFVKDSYGQLTIKRQAV